MSTKKMTKNEKIFTIHKKIQKINSADFSLSESLSLAEFLIENINKKISLTAGYGVSRNRTQYLNRDVFLTINDDPWSAVDKEHFPSEYNPCAQQILKENINNIFYG